MSQGQAPVVITKGLNIILLKHAGVQIIDSHNFIPMALARFPATFDLRELKKGYFPHFFNTEENEDYVGPLPEVDHYGPGSMSPKARGQFLQWHLEHQEDIFNMRQEIWGYCNSDVEILKQGSMKFRDQFYQLNGTDPFKTCTIPSAVMRVFRRNHLKDNEQIGKLILSTL